MPASAAPAMAPRPRPPQRLERATQTPEPSRVRSLYAIAAAGSLLLAAASLLYPSAPAYDPWAWIIWGREIVHLQLHTFGGPTWKPLPVLFTTLFAPFGGAAPALWLLIARAGGIMAVAMAGLLARRLAGPVAAALAVLGLVSLAQFFDSVALGETEGLLAALCLLAILRHLDSRPRQTLVLGFAAALIRPEVWPFFGLYAVYLWRRDAGARKLIAVQLTSIPVLWFVPDLIGSGSLTRGVQWAEFAKSGSPSFARCPFCAELSGHAWPLLAAPFKVGVALAIGSLVVSVSRRHERRVLIGLLALGLAWIVEEAIFTQAGFSGSDRYLIAPSALLIVAGAVGWGLSVASRRTGPLAAALTLTLVLVAVAPPPGPHVGRTVERLRYQARLADDMRRAVAHAGGARRILACGPVQTNPSEAPLAAWTLGARLRSTEGSGAATLIRSRNGPDGVVLPAAPPVGGYRTLARAGTVTIVSRCR